MVSLMDDRAIWEAVGEVADPEVPVLTIEDLGVLRDVRDEGDEVVVTITPTYSGCPAMDLIRHEVELTLDSLHVAVGSRPCCRRPGPPTG